MLQLKKPETELEATILEEEDDDDDNFGEDELINEIYNMNWLFFN